MNKSIEPIESMVRYSDYMISRNLRLIANQPKKWARDILVNRELRHDPFFWNNGGLLLAINRYNEKIQSGSDLKSVRLLLRKKQTINLVDNTLYYYANYDKLDKQVLHRVYEFLHDYKRDSAGTIMYRKQHTAAYLDTLGMVCPFLMRYGVENKNNEAIVLAMNQFRTFFQHGMDTASELPYHGYDIENDLKCGIVGWGRGLGWMLFGMCESLTWMDKQSEQYTELDNQISNLFDVVLKYQKKDGSFSWQLQALDGPSDSSVAGMIGYSLLKYAKTTNKINTYKAVILIIEKSVLSNVSNEGVVSGSSAECRGFSMYPQQFETNSWGQAFCTLFLTELIGWDE